MVRPLIIVINLFVLMLLKLVSNGPTADISAPSNVQAGNSFVAEVKIHANGDSDFVRFSVELPKGWKAEKIKTDGANFSFDKQKAKFLWLRVGDQQEMNISFRVFVPADAPNGATELPCVISHVLDNRNDNITLSPLKITVEGGSGTTAASTTPAVDSTAKPPVTVTVVQTTPTDPVMGEFLVDIVINKEDLVNFGKLEDTLPEGISAQAIMTDGSAFTFEKGVARFYWYVLPSKPSLHIQYKAIVSPDASGQKTISGYFSYLENESWKIVHITPSVITLKENPALADDAHSTSGNDNTQDNSSSTGTQKQVATNDQQNGNTNTQQQSSTTQTGPVNQTQEENSTTGNTQQVSSTETATQPGDNSRQNAKTTEAAGVKYSVQIAAMTRMVPVSYYKSTYNIADPVNMEQIEGLNKYTTGTFTTYQDARNHREEIRGKGVTGPFVTAYNGGKRITVQEALMITSQTWIR